jgi:RNA polymerase sigma-70 factor, ECF subfamily
MQTLHNEKELVVKAQQGNQEAKNQLCETYYTEVLKISRMIMRDWDESQDLAQEVFCKVFAQNKIKTFKGETNLKSWLFVVMRNTCYTYLRKKAIANKVVVYHSLENYEEHIPAKEMNAEEWLNQINESHMLDQAVRMLPDKYRKAIECRYFREYSYKEAGKRLGISTKHFGLRKLRALKRLRKIMKQNEN